MRVREKDKYSITYLLARSKLLTLCVYALVVVDVVLPALRLSVRARYPGYRMPSTSHGDGRAGRQRLTCLVL